MTTRPETQPQPCILVVEDEVLIAMQVAMLIEAAGFPVCGTAGAAAQALDLAARTRPTAAVVDIRLGTGPDGITLAHELRARYRCGILFMSGSGERETRDRALEVEGSVFLQKPVDPTVLVGHLRGLVNAA